MHRIVFVLFIFMTSLSLSAQHHALAAAIGRQRVLLLFAPAEEDPRLQAQLSEMRHHARECRDYDLLLVTAYLSAGPSRPPADPPTSIIRGDEEAYVRKRFHILPGDFTVLLLGKDGGEKLRSENVVAFSKIAEVIDAMPMRQQEIKHRRQQPGR